MADGILIVDAGLHVTRANPAALRLLRQREDAVSGHTLAQVVRDHELVGLVTRALASGIPERATVRLSPARGPGDAEDPRDAVRFVNATGIPLNPIPAGGRRAGLLVLQDVTEFRRTDTVRREFVANVSHELRTPIASIKALAETLEEGALEDPPAAREFLSQMHVEVDSLAQLVQELLELSRIESGQAHLRPEPVTAEHLLDVASCRLKRQAERAGVSLELDTPPNLPLALADPDLVERVLLSLVHNALKFTPSGGVIQLSAAPHPDGLCLTVQDTGSGIPPEELDRIFERFYKVDRSRASRGTGLGLAIAKHIVQAHGGRIWAESEGEGRGSTFHFTMPTATPTHVPAAPAH